jgi:hypothetical protein
MGNEQTKRSIWRETAFISMIVASNITSLDVLFPHAAKIASIFTVEKRRKKRPLQLVGF